MHFPFSSAFLTLATFQGALAFPNSRYGSKNVSKHCPPFQGNFTIKQFQLYPENADFDTKSCLLYVSNLYNGTLSIYDPYKNKIVDILEFPGITGNPAFFVSGVEVDQRTGLVSVLANAGASFITQPAGSDISGSNIVMLLDPKSRKVLYSVNLTETTQGTYGGFADLEYDPDGNVYVNGMFPGSILRLDKFNGKTAPKVKEWFLSQPRDTSIDGFGGLASKDWMLLSHDNSNGNLVKFDMRASKGKAVIIPVTPSHVFLDSDASYLPPKYKGTVLLIAGGPGIRTFRSKDGKWNSAEYLGTVTKASFGLPDNYLATAAVQVGDGLNMVVVQTGDVIVPGTLAGNRTEFPFYDITSQVESLLAV